MSPEPSRAARVAAALVRLGALLGLAACAAGSWWFYVQTVSCPAACAADPGILAEVVCGCLRGV